MNSCLCVCDGNNGRYENRTENDGCKNCCPQVSQEITEITQSW